MIWKSEYAAGPEGCGWPVKHCACNGFVKQTLVWPETEALKRGLSGEQSRQPARGNRAMVGQEPDPERRLLEHVLRPGSPGAEVPNPGVAARLAQLVPRGLPHQRVVQKDRRLGSAEKPGQPDLPAGRGQEVFPSNDQLDAVPEVVHRDGELIGPVSQPVADQQVAALRRQGEGAGAGAPPRSGSRPSQSRSRSSAAS